MGEPGVGKTSLAIGVRWVLGMGLVSISSVCTLVNADEEF